MSSPTDLPLNIKELFPYIETCTPRQLVIYSHTWPGDLTDVLAVADHFRMLKKMSHAIALYIDVFQRIEANPTLIAPDTDLGMAYAGWGDSLLTAGRAGEALEAYLKALELGFNDPHANANLASLLCIAERYDEALPLVEDVLQRPSDEVPQDVLELANCVRTVLRSAMRRASATSHAPIASPSKVSRIFSKGYDLFSPSIARILHANMRLYRGVKGAVVQLIVNFVRLRSSRKHE